MFTVPAKKECYTACSGSDPLHVLLRGQKMISLERVTKKYGQHYALRNVSLTIDRHRIAGILGRNGAGKTTLLNLITGYFPPDEGRVLVDGMDMLEKPRECKRRIGYLPEKPPLYDELTVGEYLKFVCDLREVSPRSRNRHVEEIIRICSLEKMEGRVIGNLSKGYRQRTGIAQALCGNPEVLILDEPTVGLDPMQVVEIRDLIRKLGEDHIVLFSSHILNEVQQLCNRVYILHEGRLIRTFEQGQDQGNEILQMRLSAVGKEEELLSAIRSIGCVMKAEKKPPEEPGVAEIRITGKREDARGRLTDQLFILLAAMDAPIRRLQPEKDDLETFFLEATAD